MSNPGLEITRVIGGKKYSTLTAKFVGTIVEKHMGLMNFSNEVTALYVTKRGQWFVAGQGGGATRWCRTASDGGYLPGSGIELIGAAEARGLMEEKNLPVEDFFEVEEG